MAKPFMLTLLLPLLVHIGLVWSRVESAYLPVLGVEGVVMCQHCNHTESQSLEEAWPIAGAKVELICRGSGSTPKVNEVVATNYDGFFMFLIEGFNFADDGIEGCRVTLNYSPETDCSIKTNINRGVDGARIFFRTYNENQAIYTTGPFAFAPSQKICNTAS